MVSIDLNTKLLTLGQLSSELKNIRNTTKLFDVYVEMEQKEHLSLENKLNKYWNSLIGCIPYKELVIPWNLPPLNQRVALIQWLTDLACLFDNKILGQPQNNITPKSDLQNLKIWRTSHSYYPTEAYNALPCQGDVYWGKIYSFMNTWRETIKASLEEIEWQADSETIISTLIWKGNFQAIKTIGIQDSENNFWDVSLKSGYPTHLQINSTALLLNTQLLAQWGGSRFIPVELKPSQLVFSLNIPRADIPSNQPPQPLISKNDIEQLFSFIIFQIVTGYLEASEALESVLSGEINQLESYVLKGDLDKGWFNSLQDVLHNLVLIREGFSRRW
jgi:hypothetical protein